jgi:hypothetical protein
LKHENIDILGFPFSISETFQYRNTNKKPRRSVSRNCKNLGVGTIRKQRIEPLFFYGFRKSLWRNLEMARCRIFGQKDLRKLVSKTFCFQTLQEQEM